MVKVTTISSTAVVAVVTVLALTAQLPPASAQTITDLFSWGLDYIGNEPKSGEETSLTSRECQCEGPACTCCVNFNVSYIDLGGPGCVKLKYLSQAEGLMVNVSYGSNVLHSEQVKGPKPEPACMDLLSDLAQVCARFTELTPDGDGLRGCTVLEPTLLGDTQAQYSVGCFKMGPKGMVVDPDHEPVLSSSEEEQSESETEEEDSSSPSESENGSTATSKPDLSEDALISAVNEGAEEGLAWFGSLLGINIGGGSKKNTTEATPARAERQRSLNEIPDQ